MSYEKPSVLLDEVNCLLVSEYGPVISNTSIDNSAPIAQTYSFQLDDLECIIHFNDMNMSHGHRTESYFYNRFIANNIPIRNVIKCGKYKNYNYTISKKVSGTPFHELSIESQINMAPKIFDVLSRIGKINIDESTGYGWLDENGNGLFTSWKSHLRGVKEEEPGMFYGNWHHLFKTSFLEKAKFDYYFEKMETLLKDLSEPRELVHGSFGYANVLIKNDDVAVILNWEDARYGDHIYDLASMLFWRSKELQNVLMENSFEYINNEKYEIEDFKNRVKCYKYFIGLDCMRYFAFQNNKSAYDFSLSVINQIED